MHSCYIHLIMDLNTWLFVCLKKCEVYWPQPRDKTKRVKEEDEDTEEKDGQREKENEEEGETRQIGRFLIRVKDSREKDGFTVTDMEIQVQ